MKAEYDKEIDSLLRERARRGRAASLEGGAATATHLDADEQGAYAENALPAAARAHYAAHLADCDDCRHSVTRLALAAGMSLQPEPRETATGRAASPNVTWGERLGALFAPRAWRYAVPALALLLVGAVSLVVLTRRAQRETSVAEQLNTPNAQRPQAAQQQPEAHHAPQNDNAAPTAARDSESAVVGTADSNASAPNSNSLPAKEEIAANSPRAEVAQPLTSAPLNEVVVSAPPPPASTGGGRGRAVTESPMPAPAPATGAAAASTSGDEAKAKTNQPAPELQKAEQKPGDFDNGLYENRRREQLSGPRRNEQARNARTAEADASRNRADKEDGSLAATTAPARRAAAKRSAEDATRSEGERMELAVETRAVAGRKFRRQGNAWVDTAYSAGQSYTVVRRNSEQFRALVADEPELRRIAGALGGEVTVVWKGRAYRIR